MYFDDKYSNKKMFFKCIVQKIKLISLKKNEWYYFFDIMN